MKAELLADRTILRGQIIDLRERVQNKEIELEEADSSDEQKIRDELEELEVELANLTDQLEEIEWQLDILRY